MQIIPSRLAALLALLFLLTAPVLAAHGRHVRHHRHHYGHHLSHHHDRRQGGRAGWKKDTLFKGHYTPPRSSSRPHKPSAPSPSPHGQHLGQQSGQSGASEPVPAGQPADVDIDPGPLKQDETETIRVSYIYKIGSAWSFGRWQPGGQQTKLLTFNAAHQQPITLTIPTGKKWQKLLVIYDGALTSATDPGDNGSGVSSYEVELGPPLTHVPYLHPVMMHYTPPKM